MNYNNTIRDIIYELYQLFKEIEHNYTKNNINLVLSKKQTLHLLINQTINGIEQKYYKSKDDVKNLELMKQLKEL